MSEFGISFGQGKDLDKYTGGGGYVAHHQEATYNFDFGNSGSGSHLNRKLAENNPMIAGGVTNVTNS